MTTDEKLDMIIELLEKLLKRVPSRYEQWVNEGCCGEFRGDKDD